MGAGWDKWGRKAYPGWFIAYKHSIPPFHYWTGRNDELLLKRSQERTSHLRPGNQADPLTGCPGVCPSTISNALSPAFVSHSSLPLTLIATSITIPRRSQTPMVGRAYTSGGVGKGLNNS